MVSDRVHSIKRPRVRNPGDSLHDWGEYELTGAGWQHVCEVLWDGKIAVPPSEKLSPRQPVSRAPFVGRKADLRKIKVTLTIRSIG